MVTYIDSIALMIRSNLKEVRFEVHSEMSDDVEEDGGKIDGEGVAQ